MLTEEDKKIIEIMRMQGKRYEETGDVRSFYPTLSKKKRCQ
jgi:hypothetical protein